MITFAENHTKETTITTKLNGNVYIFANGILVAWFDKAGGELCLATLDESERNTLVELGFAVVEKPIRGVYELKVWKA